MTTNNQSRVTRRDVARVLFRHWRKIAFFFVAAVALTLLVIAVYPRSYASEAKLFIRVGRESVALDPTATTGDTILLQKSQVDEINSALDMLAGRGILQDVVDRIGAERILTDAPPAADELAGNQSSNSPIRTAVTQLRSAVSYVAQQVGLSDPGTANDRAIRWLENRIKVWAPKDSTVITVTCTAASPGLAHDIVEAATETFVDQHVRINQTQGSLQFFSDQVENLFNQLTAAEAELRDRRNKFQLTSGSSRSSIIDKSKEGMRQKIYELQLAENDLKSRYTDEYPPLKEIRRQREQAEQMLSQMPIAPAAASQSTNGEQADSRGKIVQAVAVSESALETASTNEQRIARIDLELQMLNDQDLQLTQLQRKVDLLDEKYRMHVQKLEQARVNDALGQDKISNVNVAQAAAFISKPVSPRKPLLLALGLLTALCGAVGLAFCAECFDQTLRTTEQVQAQLGVPVLLSLPYRKRWGESTAAQAKDATSSNGQGNGAGKVGQLGDYRSLVREIIAEGEQNGGGESASKTVGVVGCETSMLRSRVAGDLAIQAAQSGGGPVLLIDADAGQRNVANRFHINGSSGWCEVLAGLADAKSCIHQQDIANLAIMGPGKANGPTSAARKSLKSLDGLKSGFGLVVVDLPPECESSTVPADATWLDEVILVIEAERTHIQSAQHTKEALSRAGVSVKGVVLINRREYIPRWLYQRL
jgi:uncharacterized protein involved in exopolysaccharide biosynthesis/Mrp family chromosome partitioning ATPase